MAKSPERIFIFEVALMSDRRIWRRVALRGSQTLDHLHWAIYGAFDRSHEHLYSFFFPLPGSKGAARLRDAQEYVSPVAYEGVAVPEDGASLNADRARLDRLELRSGQTFYYLFDPSTPCWHEVIVMEVEGEPEKGPYPRLLEKEGASPGLGARGTSR